MQIDKYEKDLTAILKQVLTSLGVWVAAATSFLFSSLTILPLPIWQAGTEGRLHVFWAQQKTRLFFFF